MVRAIAFALVLLIAWPTAAEELWPPRAFKCLFPAGVAAELSNSKYKPETVDAMAFTFASIDARKGTAQMVGNIGASDVIVLNTPRGLHLLESTPTGNLAVTTVFPLPENKPRFLAVHSRHVLISEVPIVSQYHGSCEGLW